MRRADAASACSGRYCFFFFQAEDGIRDLTVTGVQTCALPISEVAISRFHRVLKFIEGKRFLSSQRADDSQAQPFMNHSIDFMRAVRSAAVKDRKSVV